MRWQASSTSVATPSPRAARMPAPSVGGIDVPHREGGHAALFPEGPLRCADPQSRTVDSIDATARPYRERRWACEEMSPSPRPETASPPTSPARRALSRQGPSAPWGHVAPLTRSLECLFRQRLRLWRRRDEGDGHATCARQLCGLHGAGWPHSAADRTPLSPRPRPCSRRSPPPPAWVLSELDALPLQMSFSGPAEVSCNSSRAASATPADTDHRDGRLCGVQPTPCGPEVDSWCVGARTPAVSRIGLV